MSGNHDGDLDKALAIVRAAAEAGAHAVKLQTYTADTITLDADTPEFRLSDAHELWADRHLYDLYEEAHTPWEWHEPIFDLARELGLLAFSSPFDPTAVAFLEDLDVPAYKIASSEIVDLPLIRLVASHGQAAHHLDRHGVGREIDAAVSGRSQRRQRLRSWCCRARRATPRTRATPTCAAIPVLAEAFGTLVGLSDHTLGIGAAVASVALGACVIEKHVTLSRDGGGVDSAFSLEPAELAALVRETEDGVAGAGRAPDRCRGTPRRRGCVSAVRCSSPRTCGRVTR